MHQRHIVMVPHARSKAVSRLHFVRLALGNGAGLTFHDDPILVAVVKVAIEIGPFLVRDRVALILGLRDYCPC